MKRLSAVLVVTVAALAAAGVGSAAPPQPQSFSCTGLPDIQQILVAPANGAQADFGAARIIGGGILIPTSFDFSATDTTAGVPLFDSGLITKGGGNANHNQTTTTCSGTQTGTLADFLPPGATAPPGTSLTDTVTLTISVTAIVKP